VPVQQHSAPALIFYAAQFFSNICLLLQGFASPLPIQSAVIPRATRDRLDIFGCAETGSGKTLAYAVPVMQRALAEAGSAGWEGEAPLTCPFAIIVVPTRELGVQVYNVCT
jgi:superfamily II DNA/RNA helicase